MEEQPSRVEVWFDEALGFLWRWFWRIALWGVVAVIGLIGVLYVIDLALKDPIWWGFGLVVGVSWAAISLLSEIKRLLIQLVAQGERSAPARRVTWDDDD